MTLCLLLKIPPFIGPTCFLLVNDISRDSQVTSRAGYLVPLYMHFRHKLFYTIIIGSLVLSPLRPIVPHVPYANSLFHAFTHRFLRPVVPSSRGLL